MLKGRLSETAGRVERGEYARLADAAADTTQVAAVVEGLEAALRQYAALPPGEQARLARGVAEAGSLEALTDLLGTGGTRDATLVKAGQRRGLALPTVPRERLLTVAAFAITGLAYALILAAGWITLYVKAPTFGADPMDYLSLFLWGATVETVRGQTVSFASLRAAARRT